MIVANGVLPADLESVWGVSDRDRAMATRLVKDWGVDGFRASSVHRVALEDRERVARNRAREARRVKCAADTPPGTRCKSCGEKH